MAYTYRHRDPKQTALFQILQDHHAAFILQNPSYPKFITDTFDVFKKCGLMEFGLMRIKCADCSYQSAVAFSCKRRGFCCSCGAKAKTESAAYLVDNILPEAHYRQIVVTLPYDIRYWVATNTKLCGQIHRIVTRAITRKLMSKAFTAGLSKPAVGMINYVQRFGDALNLNPHFHLLVMEKSYQDGEKVTSRNLSPIDDSDLKEIIHEIYIYVKKRLIKDGYISNEIPKPDDVIADNPRLAQDLVECLSLPANSNQHRIDQIFGGAKGPEMTRNGPMCFAYHGFTIHGATKTNPKDRKALERLISYMARSALAEKRLSYIDGEIIYQLKRPWKDGRTQIVFTPTQLIRRLCGLVPPPRFHMIRHSGIFARSHPLRKKIIPNPDEQKVMRLSRKKCKDKDNSCPKVRNGSWSKLLARIYQIDIASCPKCGGEMEIWNVIYDYTQAKRYYEHWLQSQGPPQDNSNPQS